MRNFRRFSAWILFFCIFCSPIFILKAKAAEIPPLFGSGWEHWNVSSSKDERDVWQYDMRCPSANVTMETMNQNTLNIMAYCKAANPDPTTVTIRYTFTEGLVDLVDRCSIALNTPTGIRAVTSPFLNISALRQRPISGGIEIIVILDVNNPYSGSQYAKEIPFGAALDAAREVAASIEAKTDNPREQVILINEYLIKNVEYGSATEERRAHSIIGALVDGKAMCAGYTNAVSSLCYLLDIPYYQIHDMVNSHTWNVVKIDGEWLMLDTTFNDSFNKSTRYLLSGGFTNERHHYEEETLKLFESYVDCLWSTQLTAETLCEAGILSEPANGDFSLSKPLTYNELAVVLTRLDGADISVLPRTEIDNCPVWAVPYVSYCISAGYLDGLDEYRNSNLDVETVQQVLIDYFSGSATMIAMLAEDKWTIDGTTLLRGKFFEMMVNCYE